MPRRSFIPVSCALTLVLSAGCSDNLLDPISPDGAAPSHAVAWTETPDSVLIDFEAIPVFGGARFHLTGAGVRFPDWMTVIDPAVPSGGFHYYGLTPPTSGNHAIGLGYFYPERTEDDLVFFTPVAAVSLSVRAAGGDFVITCYDAAGVELGRQVAPGYQHPEPFPVRVQRLAISADGISWCRLSVAGGILDDFSFKRTRTPKLQLECVGDLGVNRVTRGQELRCRASASDSSAALTDVSWAFVDSAGHTISGPAGTLNWGGKMVVPGQMQVRAHIDGDSVSADSSIAVQSRIWPSMTVVAVDSGNGHLPTTPTLIQQLADTHPVVPATPIVTDSITSGPNTGWAYVSVPITSVRAVVHISAGFTPGTPLYQKQNPGTDPVTGQPFCSKYQFTTLIQTAAREHEGLLTGSTPSHVSVYKQWFSNNSPQDVVESLVGYLPNFSMDYPFTAHVDAEGAHGAPAGTQRDRRRHREEGCGRIHPLSLVPVRQGCAQPDQAWMGAWPAFIHR